MGLYLKLFDTTSQYNAYTADTANFIKPNVSLITETNTVEYNPWVETMVVAKYNVTSTSSPTQIISEYSNSPFSAIEIDGVAQPSVVDTYTFDTLGEHTVKYTLTDPTSIVDSAFLDCTSLTSIAIPSGVTSIEGWAFEKCSSLTSITIPNSVTSIGDSAFLDCTSLTSIVIPNSVASIGDNAFEKCSSLTSITIPNSVTSIGSGAFWGCRSLTSIDIPSGVTTIDNEAFYSCRGLTSIVIPDSVTSIGDNAFGGLY